ncbi:MAG: hypothetical protein KatS3mg019_1601 [Fimbriimonadales bacterium]|nr:MAG: hypothetical protein KatS3mg019_1601 [Fimbriimonadales bacterium]
MLGTTAGHKGLQNKLLERIKPPIKPSVRWVKFRPKNRFNQAIHALRNQHLTHPLLQLPTGDLQIQTFI